MVIEKRFYIYRNMFYFSDNGKKGPSKAVYLLNICVSQLSKKRSLVEKLAIVGDISYSLFFCQHNSELFSVFFLFSLFVFV